MDFEQVRTFLSVAANGSFLEAAKRLHVTQSTVSARIQNLEDYLGTRLFVRNRAGASLTPTGKRFLRHAKSLVLTLEQARHDVGLPGRFSASITVGARIALWEGFLPRWVGHMRDTAPDISIRSEISFEEDLMRRLIEGTLDIGMMYTPQHSPGLEVEHLFDERLVLLTTDPDQPWPGHDYIFVNWGPAFYAQHRDNFPDLEQPAQTVNIGWLGIQLILCNGGSCFVPIRMAESFIDSERLFVVPDSPEFRLPAYMVYPRESESDVIGQALAGLRLFAETERHKYSPEG
ncbi:LysR family transcriptional regulator [Thiohalobacter thiocyanaticus]|uniref:LysR family transcriptional regulator n=1 Tax=Thiohalobacter thiocyanaticus TaxID=585455 RepID=A0A426QH31_9GAMM|nr:LysR family transcriptional regulator [Thiohalobacter thiocyanaticus]RRQ21054.1 LysR family transcriptional regulator [Thiohalobacter thiocyanaticus]